ncbi:hypothetical protein GCM10027091_44360 [Streptomyces daliensis]
MTGPRAAPAACCDEGGTARHRAALSARVRYLDVNKLLKFHYEETTLHWSEAPARADGVRRRVPGYRGRRGTPCRDAANRRP